MTVPRRTSTGNTTLLAILTVFGIGEAFFIEDVAVAEGRLGALVTEGAKAVVAVGIDCVVEAVTICALAKQSSPTNSITALAADRLESLPLRLFNKSRVMADDKVTAEPKDVLHDPFKEVTVLVVYALTTMEGNGLPSFEILPAVLLGCSEW